MTFLPGNISEQIIYKSVDKCTESNSVIPDMAVLKYTGTVIHFLYKTENSNQAILIGTVQLSRRIKVSSLTNGADKQGQFFYTIMELTRRIKTGFVDKVFCISFLI